MSIEIKKSSNKNLPITVIFKLPAGKGLGLSMPMDEPIGRAGQDRKAMSQKTFVVDSLKKLFKVKKINATDFDIRQFTSDRVWVEVSPKRIGGKPTEKALSEERIPRLPKNIPDDINDAANIGPEFVKAMKKANWVPVGKGFYPWVLPLSSLDTGSSKLKTFKHKSNPEIMITLQNKLKNRLEYIVYSDAGRKIIYKAETARSVNGIATLAKNVAKKFNLSEAVGLESIYDRMKDNKAFKKYLKAGGEPNEYGHKKVERFASVPFELLQKELNTSKNTFKMLNNRGALHQISDNGHNFDLWKQKSW